MSSRSQIKRTRLFFFLQNSSSFFYPCTASPRSLWKIRNPNSGVSLCPGDPRANVRVTLVSPKPKARTKGSRFTGYNFVVYSRREYEVNEWVTRQGVNDGCDVYFRLDFTELDKLAVYTQTSNWRLPSLESASWCRQVSRKVPRIFLEGQKTDWNVES